MLRSKDYPEAGRPSDKFQSNVDRQLQFKRMNKNRPREVSSKRVMQVPLRNKSLQAEVKNWDPRFDDRAGDYDAIKFKNNYKFVAEMRQKEVKQMKLQMKHCPDVEQIERRNVMQKMINKNIEDHRWQAKQAMANQERLDILKSREAGEKPRFLTKKERHAKNLVMQFEQLKKAGTLAKHMVKRRKKNVAKDRKKMRSN